MYVDHVFFVEISASDFTKRVSVKAYPSFFFVKKGN